MLADAGARLAIVGHSERREAQGESDAEVKAKAETALAAGLRVILCVGESDKVREAGNAIETVSAQLDASLPATIADGRLAGMALVTKGGSSGPPERLAELLDEVGR